MRLILQSFVFLSGLSLEVGDAHGHGYITLDYVSVSSEKELFAGIRRNWNTFLICVAFCHQNAGQFLIVIFLCLDSPSGSGSSPCRGCEITLRHTTLDRSPLDEWSARHRFLYLTTQNIHKDRHPCPRRDSNPIIPASERPQAHALDRAVTGIGP
jgi:hypothetical protein